MNEQTFRNMLVFLSRAQANGANEARALCECVDAVSAILAAAAVPVPSTPEPPTIGGERLPAAPPSAGGPVSRRPVLSLVEKAA